MTINQVVETQLVENGKRSNMKNIIKSAAKAFGGITTEYIVKSSIKSAAEMAAILITFKVVGMAVDSMIPEIEEKTTEEA